MRGLGLALIGVAVLAQPVRQPPSNDIPKLLKSKQPSERAWGATLAADAGDRKYVPDILRLLERKRETDNDRLVPYYAFDALMRLDAEVPEKTLRPLVREHAGAIAVLAKQGSPAYENLLPQLMEFARDDAERSAIGSLLRERLIPLYSERVLSEWTLSVDLLVMSPPKPVAPGEDAVKEIPIQTSNFTAMFGSPHSCSTNEPSFRFPPFPKSFYPALSNCRANWGLSMENEREQYIRALYPRGFGGRNIIYRDSKQVVQEAAKLRADAEQYLDFMLTDLRGSGAIPKGSRARPKLRVTITDVRTDKSVPLPEIPGLLP